MQCNPCGDVHSFRKPRGDVEDDVPEPIAAKKRALMKKPTFDEFFAKHSDKNAKPYEFREHYHENVIVTHPKFGRGFVSEIMSDSKVEITFKDSRRVLVHNRRDMPGLPLAAEGDGHPSDAKLSGKVAKAPVKGEKPEKAAPPAKAEKPEKPEKAATGKKGEKVEKAAAKAEKPAEKAAAPAKAPKPPVTRAQPPAAKVAKRTTKPARPVHIASAKRAHPPTAKRAAKVAKRGKK